MDPLSLFYTFRGMYHRSPWWGMSLELTLVTQGLMWLVPSI